MRSWECQALVSSSVGVILQDCLAGYYPQQLVVPVSCGMLFLCPRTHAPPTQTHLSVVTMTILSSSSYVSRTLPCWFGVLMCAGGITHAEQQ